MYLCILFLCIVSYFNSREGGFVFDDIKAVVNNKDVNPYIASLPDIFQHDFWGNNMSSSTSHKSYRPLTILSFQLDYMIANGITNPLVFHVTNILLHCIVTILYTAICNNIISAFAVPLKHSSFIAGVLFAVHPIHCEAVAGIVGRAELLSAVMYFISLACYTKSINSNFWLVASLIFAFLAMLFKEQGITILAICISYDILVTKKLRLIRCTTVLSYIVLALWIRYVVMVTGPPKFHKMDNPSAHLSNFIYRVLSYNYIYLLNFWLLLDPWWLCFDWSMGCIPTIESLIDVRIPIIITFWIAIITFLLNFALNQTNSISEKRLLIMTLSLGIIPFLPATNIFFNVGFVIAERTLYLPSSGYCLLVAVGFDKLIVRWKKTMWAVLIVLVCVNICQTIRRNNHWNNEETLFMSALNVCPLNAKVHYNIGKVKSEKNLLKTAEESYREAIRLYPDYDQALNNLGNLLKETSRPIEAEEMLTRAVNVSPEFAAAWMNLAIVQTQLKKYKKAEDSYRKAIHYRHIYPDAYYNLGNMYIELKHHLKAVKAFQTAIKLNPYHFNAWNNLGLLYQNTNDFKNAFETFKEASKLMPQQSDWYFNMGVVLGQMSLYEESKANILKAIEINPKKANYYGNLGVIYHLEKQYDKAEMLYRKALEIDPNLNETSKNLDKLISTKRKN